MTPLPVVDALDSITIAVPCPVSWDAMHGDHRTRFCDHCNQNVHDVSELTREEAVKLVTGGAETPCLRVHRRPDGRVMTADCTTKRERVWKWLRRRSRPVAWLFGLVFLAGCERGCMMGGITGPEPEPDPTKHLSEHDERVREGARVAEQSESRMEAEARAAAPVRHEGVVGQ